MSAPEQAPQPATPTYRPTVPNAIAGLVFSLLWLGGIGSLISLLNGHTALSDIRRSGGRLGGEGVAIAALVLGYIGLLPAVLLWIALFAAQG